MKLRAETVLRDFGRLFPPHIKERGRHLFLAGLLDPVEIEDTGYTSTAHGEGVQILDRASGGDANAVWAGLSFASSTMIKSSKGAFRKPEGPAA